MLTSIMLKPFTRIISYINNLHPKYTELYRLIEKIIDASIPLWERTLAPLHADEPKFFERIICKQVRYEGEDEEGEDGEKGSDDEDQWTDMATPEDTDGDENVGGDGNAIEEEVEEEENNNVEGSGGGSKDSEDEGEDDEDDDDDDDDGEGSDGDNSDGTGFDLRYDNENEEEKPVIQPEPKAFDAEKFEVHKPLSFKELYGRQGRPLQIIVKLANIELTPDKPKYNGGTWHVEGKQVAPFAFPMHSRNSTDRPSYVPIE